MFKVKGIDSWTLQKGKSISPRDIEIELDNAFRIEAKVYGTRSYNLVINREENFIDGVCTCPAFDGVAPCKHLAALWLHLPPEFSRPLNPRTTYLFNQDSEEDWDDEEFYESHHFRPETTVQKLNYLQGIVDITMGTDPLQEFYDRKLDQITYRLYSDLYLSHFRFTFEVSKVLKSGAFGKARPLTNSDDAYDAIDVRLRPYLVQDLYQRNTLMAEMSSEDAVKFLPAFLNSHTVLDVHGQNVTFLPVRHSLKIQIDSRGQRFSVLDTFSDGITRAVSAFNPNSGLGKTQTSYFISDSRMSSEVYGTLKNLENAKMNQKDWIQFKELVLHLMPELLAGDKFYLPVESYTPVLSFHFKYHSPEHIEAIALKQKEKGKDKILIENQEHGTQFLRLLSDCLNMEISFGVPFKCDHKQLIGIIPLVNDQGIEIKTFNQKVRAFKKIELKVTGKMDWFESTLQTDNGEDESLLRDILNATQSKGGFITLKNGDQVLLPIDLQRKLNRLAKFSILKNGKLQTHKTRALLLEEWEERELVLDEGFVNLRSKFSDFKKIGPISPHSMFAAKLRDYQALGLGWMNFLESIQVGGCLADDMGLGKTIQVLSHLQRRKYLIDRTECSLIVCPKSLIFNWTEEAGKFSPDLRVKTFTGGAWNNELLNCDILVTSYSLLQRNIGTLSEILFDYVILDEAQFIKNSSSLTAKACRLLKANHRLALTGTPIENHMGDLMSIFNFLIPRCFSSTLITGKQVTSQDLSFLRPFMLRRTKQEVLTELPPKTVQVIYCEQDELEKKYYDQILKLAKGEISSQENKIQILTALMRLRQASCHLGLINPNLKKSESGKFKVLKEMVHEIIEGGNKVLIFSQFTELLTMARAYLGMDDSNSSYLDGKSRGRQELVNSFKTDVNKNCFFVSLKAGGTGLNLTEANYCFILDPWWNPAVENQAIDRIHRMGQKNPVNAYRLITRNTIEEKVLELQKMKTDLAKDFMEGNEDFIRKLTPQDLNFLLER